ncbi:E3 ubiquitin-protein ligase XIAP [Elysia marginata]|uniref:E3 ubiquitin-protein ligase XIAP n=1 Tax=Elysia marginata TaxID=1093978 RepID=A0AAV4IAJ4_9GAST|nr:E3 ubiquitin-protein ligase XIAP [Elysia marginata]
MDYLTEAVAAPEYERLQTFYISPLPKENQLSLSNTPMKFAEAGFVRTPTALADEVECSACGIKYKGWAGESPLAVHRTLSPNCPFLNTPPTPLRGSSHSEHPNINTIRRQLFPNTSSMSSAADFKTPFLPKCGDTLMLFESHRLMTYCNVHSAEAAMYAKAGFILNKSSGKVVCVFCDIEIDRSSHLGDLEEEHTNLSPDCPYNLGYDVGNISRYDEERIRLKKLDQTRSDKLAGKLWCQCNYIIKHPEFEDRESRKETFATWPKLHTSLFPPDLMVQSGFYYSGFMDRVQCYACGVALYNWSPPADPARQHAKASPSCHFLIENWGQEFIQAAQTDEMIVDAEHEEATDEAAAASGTDSYFATSPSTSSSTAAATSSASPSSSSASPGSPTLDLEAVKAAMACQYPKYSIERIAHAIRKFFVDSCGRYPNTGLLLGTLKAADENHVRLVEKSQEVAVKDSVIQAKDSVIEATRSELQAKDSVIEATRSELQAKDSVIEATRSELQRAAFELQWRNLEMRSELEQQFVGQIQQARELYRISRYRVRDSMLSLLDNNSNTLNNKYDVETENFVTATITC